MGEAKRKRGKTPLTGPFGEYRRAGYQLIPLCRWDSIDNLGRQRGKSPRDGRWRDRAYSDADVNANAANGNNTGVRLTADMLVVDVDPRNMPDGRDVLGELDLEVNLRLDDAPHVITGSGGHHYYMRKPADMLVLDSLPDFPGVEFKCLGRQVVAAGSLHPCGHHYEWDDFAPPLSDAPMAPASLLRLIKRPERGQATGEGTCTPVQLSEMLEHLDPTDYSEHGEWLAMMMACHHATSGDGRQEFVDWSTQDPEYADHAWTIGRRWDSLHVAGQSGRAVTSATLFKAVLEAGGTIPHSDPEDDFDEVEGGEEDDHGTGAEVGRRTALDEMNERHCVVSDGGKFRVFTEEFDPVLKRHYFVRHTKTDFEDLQSNRQVEVPTGDGVKCVPKGHWWLRQPGRRQYRGVIFDPEREHEGWLNLWRGWAVQPKKGDWGLLRELLREVLCDGDARLFEYVMNWSANVVQRPGSPAEVALFFRGEKGTGKGTFGRALAGLAGRHGLQISSPGHLTGRFNLHLKDCVVLFADEAFWAGDKAGESVLKQLVTEPTIQYEGKGTNSESGRNTIHIVGASNSDWVVPAGLDGERRFCVGEVNGKAKGDKERFKAINRQLYQEGGMEAMLYDLLKRDIADWHPRDDVPDTKALMDQKLRSMEALEEFWYERMLEGALTNARGDWSEGPVLVLSHHLHEDYVHATQQRGVRSMRSSQVQLGMHLTKLCPGIERTKVKAMDTDVGMRTDAQGRAPAYRFPSLADCRLAFERKLGGRVDWDGAPSQD